MKIVFTDITEDILSRKKELFYEESDQYRKDISVKQREKGTVKYPEPFNPNSWTDEELADHAMMEFHDGQEYVAGMRHRMRQLRAIINYQDAMIPMLQGRIKELEANLRGSSNNA